MKRLRLKSEDAGRRKRRSRSPRKRAIETETVEKTTARELFEYVNEAEGRKDYD